MRLIDAEKMRAEVVEPCKFCHLNGCKYCREKCEINALQGIVRGCPHQTDRALEQSNIQENDWRKSMTNEQAIIELRCLISDDRTDREREALLIAIEKLREKRPQGEWEENENGTGFCSKCYEGIYYRTPTGRVYMMLKEQIVKFGYKYCPNCGAQMKGGAENG